MNNRNMNNLQETTNELHKKKTPEEQVDALLQAFELFCEETGRLETAYGKLKEEFQFINQELELSNDELKLKLLELNQLTHYLDSILGHISQGLLFITAEGIITTYNLSAEKILEKKQSLVENRPFKEVFNDQIFGFSMEEALLTKKFPSFIRVTLPTDPEKEDKLIEVETQRLTQEKTEGLIVTLRDTTEMRKMEIAAQHADRMSELGKMAGLVAHEIRNPLGGIKGFASLLKRDLKDQPELEKMADYIVVGSNNLNDKVSQILDFARPVTPHLASVPIKPLIEEVKTLVELDTKLNPQPKFSINVNPTHLTASIDQEMIKGVLLNLFINAQQAMPKGGTLHIEALQEKNHLVVSVTDQGKGISPENIEKLFTPFFSTKEGGNGYGLAEVQKIILAHGGTISVHSKVNKGTTFTIKIPQKV